MCQRNAEVLDVSQEQAEPPRTARRHDQSCALYLLKVLVVPPGEIEHKPKEVKDNMRTGTTIRAVTTVLLVTLAAMSNAIAGSGDDNDASYPEVGVEWVNDYTYPYSDLSNCDDSANGLYNRLGNIGWTKRFNKGNSNAKATHFESAGQDSSYIDAVDIALYSGHGHSNRLDISTVWEKVYYNEAQWGDYDLEWIGLDCCYAGSSYFAHPLNGIHLICGFSTTASDFDNGKHWADYLIDDGAGDDAYTVKNSWFYGMDVHHGAGTTLRVNGENADCGTDYIWGQGSVITDPPVDGSYTYWTYNCN